MVKKPSEIIERINTKKKDVELMPSGFKKMDIFLDGGFMRKELVVIGGSTGIGKSNLASQIQFNIARKGFKTAYFSLEISNEMIVARLIGSLSNIKPSRITSGFLDAYEYEEKLRAQGKIIAHEACLDFSDDIYEFEALKKDIAIGKYDFVVVDFIQNIEIERINEEYARLTKVTRELQKLAKELDCCIMALSQLSNLVAREKSDKSVSIEYRGSGAIAHACDLGFFIERGEQIDTLTSLKLFLKKNRRGPSGFTFYLLFKSPGGLIVEDKLYD